jgi:hypothetical protein
VNLPLYKTVLLLVLNAFLVFYLAVAGINLALRLTTGNQLTCSPLFCSEIIDETNTCLISTPGSDNCLKIAGSFVVLAPLLAYSLFGLSLVLAFYFSKRFYLSRILIVLLFLALLLFFTRVLIGAVSLSLEGMLVEFNKLGLNPPIFSELGAALFQMINPKF